MRFEPGDVKTVTLCDIGGAKIISGGNRLASGVVDVSRTDAIVAELQKKGFKHTEDDGAVEVTVDTTISRDAYAAMFGPTVGDRVRLGDSPLWIQVEADKASCLPFVHSLNLQAPSIRRCTAMKSSLAVGRPFVKAWARQPTGLRRRPWTSSSRMRSLWTGLESTRQVRTKI